MEKLSDISLVTKVVMLHDRKSFDLLVKKYQSPIRGFFLRQTLGDVQLSDDLAQDTFVKAYTHLSGSRVRRSSPLGFTASPITCGMITPAVIRRRRILIRRRLPGRMRRA